MNNTPNRFIATDYTLRRNYALQKNLPIFETDYRTPESAESSRASETSVIVPSDGRIIT